MDKSRELGMRTFDWSLFELYNDGHISYEEAIRNADSANELRLNIKLKSTRGEPASAGLALSMQEEPSAEELERQRPQELLKQQEKKRQIEQERLEQLHLERQRQLHSGLQGLKNASQLAVICATADPPAAALEDAVAADDVVAAGAEAAAVELELEPPLEQAVIARANTRPRAGARYNRCTRT